MGGVAFWGDVLPDTCLARPFFLNTFALEALRNHLNRWARVGVNCENTNDSPQVDCLILQRADDSALKEVKPGPSFLAEPESSPTRPGSS